MTPTPLPVSTEMLRLREIRRELHHIYLSTPNDFPKLERPDEFGIADGRTRAWRDVMRNQHQPTERQIIGRKKPTWRDCVEIAEVCIHTAAREWHGLDTTKPMHALVWAVLSAGGIDEVYIPEIGNFSLDEEAGPMTSSGFNRAYMAIDDDVCTVRGCGRRSPSRVRGSGRGR